jgi:hypothetical protein
MIDIELECGCSSGQRHYTYVTHFNETVFSYYFSV